MTVVVGFDASPASVAALDAAVEAAGRYGEDVVIVYGVKPPDAGVGEELRAHETALEELGRRVTGEALERARAAGVTAEVVLVRERPAPALVQVAAE
ncbi:MAG TPA: universal stress protein, partial [Solirubrobacteraceae bacterium]|nr:universal stress protein [Solirubrobacteraceae bacterium]